ncbi:hypothetical protein MLD38_025801 [Melastoma candidum]|uniref:Uncharacterized protein n=1 Tax=Melastoma candidum TaxID=119954 RepID=A0ACB9NXG5_9MYRT|nr:hypothetical protein MLD38_025801 [Melastoma candidum]
MDSRALQPPRPDSLPSSVHPNPSSSSQKPYPSARDRRQGTSSCQQSAETKVPRWPPPGSESRRLNSTKVPPPCPAVSPQPRVPRQQTDLTVERRALRKSANGQRQPRSIGFLNAPEAARNRGGELYSLVRFLQIVPFSYYFCKDCDCRALDHVSSQACRDCSHAPKTMHPCWSYVQAGTVLNNYANIFDLLNRLRQAVDYPYLVVYSRTAVSRNETLSNGATVEQECGLCHDPAEDPVVTSCMHVFCKGCLADFSASLGQVSCPKCSKPLPVDLTSKSDAHDESTRSSAQGFRSTSILNRIQLDDFQTSTKIEALIKHTMQQKRRTLHPSNAIPVSFIPFFFLLIQN